MIIGFLDPEGFELRPYIRIVDDMRSLSQPRKLSSLRLKAESVRGPAQKLEVQRVEQKPCDSNVSLHNQVVLLVLPIVSIVVPFLGLPYRILNRILVKLLNQNKGTTMETRGTL